MKEFKLNITPGPWESNVDTDDDHDSIGPIFSQSYNYGSESSINSNSSDDDIKAIQMIPEMYAVCQAAIELVKRKKFHIITGDHDTPEFSLYTSVHALLEKHGTEKP